MRKEVSTYLFVGLLLVATFLAVYYLNAGFTGFAVLGESGNGFNGTFQNTLYNSNLSAVVLDSSTNATSGTYTSKIFDAGSSAYWNNLTSEKVTPENTTVSFQVRNCSLTDCSNSSFANVSDLSNFNLTGQYFQYKVSFLGTSSFDNETNLTTYTSPTLSSVSVGYSTIPAPVVTSLLISEPTGTKSSGNGIPLNFTSVGEGLTCWYDVRDSSDNAEIMGNTTIPGCNSLTFGLGVGEGSYTLNLYANGTSGFASKHSSFSIDIPSSASASASTGEEDEPSVPVVETPIVEAPVVMETPKVTALTAQAVVTSTLIPGNSEQIKWIVQNTGTEPVSACVFKPTGEYASWISGSNDGYNLNPGASQEFAFTITTTNETAEGTFTLSVSAECAETSVAKDFTLVVEKKKLDFEIIDAQRTGKDRIRVIYSLEELTGKSQNVTVYFSLLDLANKEVANSSQNRTLNANQTKEFTVNIPINASVNGSFVGNYSLSAIANSEVYKTTVLEPITLGMPVGGFAVFTGLGTGSYVLVVGLIVVLLVVFFVVRRMRKKKTTKNPVSN